jgi:hypothetical protein
MSELEFQAERQMVFAWLGTTLGTILPMTPPQMTLEILSTRYVNPGFGTPTAFLVQTPVKGPFSTAGTLAATIDAVTLDSSLPTAGGENAADAIITADPGFALAGLTNAGSIGARITYQYRYGRN